MACRLARPGISAMRLTAYTDYTLRTLMYLAVNTSRLATIAEVARTYRISETHLMKVVHQLGVAGDIETLRGRNGGLRLARPAEAINLGSVVRRTEEDMDLVACFDGLATCAISEICVLQAVLHEALAAFLGVLDRFTLADLVAPRAQLAILLGVAAHPQQPGPAR
jgi:Rrf2 family transcriptional regulator, nitric oxide-sensitive transcriptional repressor